MTAEPASPAAPVGAPNYYADNPVFEATVFSSTGAAEILITNTESAIMAGLRDADLGWMRGAHLWTPEGAPYVLPADGYAVDPFTLEITLI